jgi:hypothetical protein
MYSLEDIQAQFPEGKQPCLETLRRLCRRGVLKPRRIGKFYFVEEAEVKLFLLNQLPETLELPKDTHPVPADRVPIFRMSPRRGCVNTYFKYKCPHCRQRGELSSAHPEAIRTHTERRQCKRCGKSFEILVDMSEQMKS